MIGALRGSCGGIKFSHKQIINDKISNSKLTKVSMAVFGSAKKGEMIIGSFPPITESDPFLSVTVPELDPLIRVSIEDDACCLRSISLWHLEHMYAVVALPKNPQLLIQRMGPSRV